MTFITNKDRAPKVGDRVRLTRDVDLFSGTFTKGHEFVVVSVGPRGADLVDDEDRPMFETLRIADALEIVS